MSKVKFKVGKVKKKKHHKDESENWHDKFRLAQRPNKPCTSLLDAAIMIYGDPGIGKTTLFSHQGKVHYFMWQPGSRFYELYEKQVRDWKSFVKYIDLLEEDTEFSTIVIDTIDLAYEACFKHMCEEMGINHPQDEKDYGKSWGVLNTEFMFQIKRILSLDKGKVFISHTKEVEVENKDGDIVEGVRPALKGSGREWLLGELDVVGYYHYRGSRRYLQVAGTELVEAKLRADAFFNAKDGERVRIIPMGRSSLQAYNNLVKAFNNEQETAEGDLKAKKKAVRIVR